MSSIPNELLEEILSRMPVRILIRFKCVCKSWRDLISSADFINLHLINYNTSSFILVNSISEENRSSISPVYPPDTPLAARSTVDFAFPPGCDRQHITASCNGLICLWDMKNIDNIALWNPATKDLKMIPKSNLPRRSKFVSRGVVIGLDDARNDYKIIQALGDDKGVQFELYSLNTGLWKRLDMDIRAVMKPPCHFSSHSTGERIVCWLAKFITEVDARSLWELVLFDMSTERFEIVRIPVKVSKHDYLSLIPYEGSIGVTRSFPDITGQELWALNDMYSGSGGLRSWRKVSLPICPPSMSVMTKTVAYWEDYLLYHDVGTKSLILYDHVCQGFISPVCVSRHKYVPTTTRYQESLVRLI